MDARYFGLSAADVRPLAYQLPIRNVLPPPFSHKKSCSQKQVGKGLLQNTLTSFSEITTRLLATDSYTRSNRKSRSQQGFFLVAQSQFEDPFPTNTDDAGYLFCSGLFSQDKCGSSGFSAESGVTVTVL